MTGSGCLAALAALLRYGKAPHLSDEGWSAVLALADAALVTPALARCDLPAGEIADYVAGVHTLTIERTQALQHQLAELGAAFGAGGVALLLLKGAAALPDLPQATLGDRLCSDLDVAVRPEALEAARSLLAGLGYARLDEGDPDGRTDGTWARPRDRAGIDLHLRVMPDDALLPIQELWRSAVPVPEAGPTTFRPDASHRVAHLVLHEMLHHQGLRNGWINPRALLDLRGLMAAHPDWAWLEAHFRQGATTLSLQVMLLAADRLLGTGWPLAARPSLAARLVVARMLRGTDGGIAVWAVDVAIAAAETMSTRHLGRLYGSGPGGPLLWRLRHLAGLPRRLAARR